MWLTIVETDGHGVIEEHLLSQSEQGDEFLLMGLRLKEGIDPSRFHTIAGRPLDPARIGDLISHEMIEWTEHGRLRVTHNGFPVLDSVVADLAA
jgi:oxygen-independent coproporphyrinogen-3 oxidase